VYLQTLGGIRRHWDGHLGVWISPGDPEAEVFLVGDTKCLHFFADIG